MNMPGRKYQDSPDSKYRYSMNGQEKSDELNENLTTAMYWEYDSRIGRRWNVDPVLKVWESPYLTFGANPIINVDPNGDDWYKNKKNGNIEYKSKWHGKHKGYESLGKGNGDWLNYKGKDYNARTGQVLTTLETVTVSASRKKDNSLMERALQVSNVTNAEKEAYAARPKPAYYDPNPLKTIFWDGSIGQFNPIEDVDIYASESIKQKQEYSAGKSRTLVLGGIQGGFTTLKNESGSSQGFYCDYLDLRNSYGSVKIAPLKTELRFIPLNGLGSNNTSFFGDYSPTFRSLTDFNFRGVPCQFETGMGLNRTPSVGLRSKVEIPWIGGVSAEVVVGARLHLQLPPIIKALMNQ
jgi:hypothetical protein